MPFSPATYALGLAAAVLMGFSKTGVPGAAIAAVGLMAAAFADDAKLSVGAMLPVLLVGDVFAVAYYQRHAQWNKMWGLFPFVAVGLAAGYWLLSLVNGNELRPILGGLVLGMLALDLLRRRFNWKAMPHSRWFVGLTGGLAGFGTMVGNAAGPVMTAYLVGSGLSKEQFVGTAAWFFFIVNLSKTIPFWLQGMFTGETLRINLVSIPGVLVGALAGVVLLPRLPQRLFNALVLLLAAVAGVWLVL